MNTYWQCQRQAKKQITIHHKEESKEENQQLTPTIKGTVKNLGDSLKVTVQSSFEDKHIIQKLDLYDYAQLEKRVKLTSKALGLETDKILTQWQNFSAEIRERTTTKNHSKNYYIRQSYTYPMHHFFKV